SEVSMRWVNPQSVPHAKRGAGGSPGPGLAREPLASAVQRVSPGPGLPPAPAFSAASEDEDALAGGLRVEQAIRLVRLLEPEAVGEQLLQRDLAVGDEARALLLARVRERPRGVDGELAPQHVLAHVDRRLPALAHEGHASPRAGRLQRAEAALGRAGAIHRRLRALAVSQLVNGG